MCRIVIAVVWIQLRAVGVGLAVRIPVGLGMPGRVVIVRIVIVRIVVFVVVIAILVEPALVVVAPGVVPAVVRWVAGIPLGDVVRVRRITSPVVLVTARVEIAFVVIGCIVLGSWCVDWLREKEKVNVRCEL